MAPAAATYEPRDPSRTVLYTVIADHLETFVVYRNSKRTFCHRRTAKRCVPHVSSAFPGQLFACTLNI